MVLKTEKIKNVCSKIAQAVDISPFSVLTETMQLQVANGNLYMSVTNKQYYVSVKINDVGDCDFNATVNAKLFLSLINNTTSEQIEFTVTNKVLVVTGNGTYKLPLVYDGDQLLSIPTINVNNVESTFNISGSILRSVYYYNGKEMVKGPVDKRQPIKNFYYFDDSGCITFADGACVNNFTTKINKPVLLNGKLVKLFNLFTSEDNVVCKVGKQRLTGSTYQHRIGFETDSVIINCILDVNADIKMFPASKIRALASKDFPLSLSVKKKALLETLNRIALILPENINAVCLTAHSNKVFVSDFIQENVEELTATSNLDVGKQYKFMVNISDFKTTISSINNQDINISFGDHTALVFKDDNITIVLPEEI